MLNRFWIMECSNQQVERSIEYLRHNDPSIEEMSEKHFDDEQSLTEMASFDSTNTKSD